MHYIIESLLVGLYTWFIYMIFSFFFTKNLYILLLVVGFSKHFLGYVLQIHTWYCNNGYACIKSLNNYYESKPLHLIRDSLLEAILFLVVGFILNSLVPRKLTNSILFFTIGVTLHIIFEKLLVHKYFCETRCKIKT